MCVHLVYFTDNWHILWPFGVFHGYSVDFSRFLFTQEKSGNHFRDDTKTVQNVLLKQNEKCH
jgi:hypothetical protein